MFTRAEYVFEHPSGFQALWLDELGWMISPGASLPLPKAEFKEECKRLGLSLAEADGRFFVPLEPFEISGLVPDGFRAFLEEQKAKINLRNN